MKNQPWTRNARGGWSEDFRYIVRSPLPKGNPLGRYCSVPDLPAEVGRHVARDAHPALKEAGRYPSVLRVLYEGFGLLDEPVDWCPHPDGCAPTETAGGGLRGWRPCPSRSMRYFLMSSSSHLRSRRVPCRIAAGIRPLASQYLTVDAGAFSFSATCETVNSMSLAYGFCHTAVNMPFGPFCM